MVNRKEFYKRPDKRAVLSLDQARELEIEGAVTAARACDDNGFLADHRGGFLIITPPPDDRIVYASSLARQYLGAIDKETEIVGIKYFDFFNGNKRCIRKKLVSPKRQEVRVGIQTLEGEISELSIIKIPVRGNVEYGLGNVEHDAHLYTLARIQEVGLIRGRHGEKLY